jgi:hypothetical protein
MTDIVFIIGQTKDEIIDALKMKSTLEEIGINVEGILTNEANGEVVPREVIERIFSVKVINNPIKES